MNKYLRIVHYFYWGGGSYRQNTSQKHMTPPSFVETKKVMTPLWDIQKSDDPLHMPLSRSYLTTIQSNSIIKNWLTNQNFLRPLVESRGIAPGQGPGGGAPGSS